MSPKHNKVSRRYEKWPNKKQWFQVEFSIQDSMDKLHREQEGQKMKWRCNKSFLVILKVEFESEPKECIQEWVQYNRMEGVATVCSSNQGCISIGL